MTEYISEAIRRGYTADYSGRIFNPQGNQLKEVIKDTGYKIFGIRFEGKMRTIRSHRFICAYFQGADVLQAKCIRHLDNNKLNNRPENLRPGSDKENFHDNPEHQRNEFAISGASTRRKLTDEQVLRIRLLLHHTPIKDIAREFRVTSRTIVQIRDGKSYKWL